MKTLRVYLILTILLSLVSYAKAQYLQFIENKGQWDNRIKYKGQIPNGNFYLQPNGYKVVLQDAAELNAVQEKLHNHTHGATNNAARSVVNAPEFRGVRSHSYEVKFLYANKEAEIIPEKPISTYNNYFIGNDPSKWAADCKIYTAVTYKNVYPGIDVRYYSGNNNLKYDIIVQPHADISKVALLFDGVDDLKIKNEELLVKTSVQEVRELKPYSYLISAYGKKTVNCRYILKGNILRFELDNYDKNATLVIDPTLVFSTFTGSTSDNWGYTATFDGAGNFYAGGIVFGNDNYGIGNGPWFDNSFNGGEYDMYIMKLNPSGSNRLYATYIGGGGKEQPHSLIVDKNGNLIIAGRTTSPDYPNTLGTPAGGLYDIVITMLNASGNGLINSRRIGGSGNDGVNIAEKVTTVAPPTIRRNYGDDARSEVIIDRDGNICLASCSQSSDFPLVNPTQAANGGGVTNQDAVLIKLSSDLSSVIFSTYFGGNGDDAAFVISENPLNGKLYVGGATTSSNFPGDKTGVLYPAFQGSVADGFVSIFSTTGQLEKTTYMGTSNGADVVFGLKFDRKGFPYVTGTTTGTWPVFNAAYVNAGAKQFIAKLKADLSEFIYSTTFGKNATVPSISIIAFLVDRCENVYVSGWGGDINSGSSRTDYVPGQNTFNMPITPDARQKENQADGSDFYFFVLEKNAAGILYGSYFGQTGGFGEHVDGGTSRFDENGVIYQALCANCDAVTLFPTTGGVWSPSNGSNRCNMAAVKMAFNLAGVGSSIKSEINGKRDSSGCMPVTVTFTDTLAMAVKYVWSYGDGTKRDTTTVPTVNHTFTQPGFYKIMLIAIDSSACNIADTSYKTIRVRNDEAKLLMSAEKQQPCQALSFKFSNLSTAPPGKPFKNNSFIWNFGDGIRQVSGTQPVIHNYASPGTYKVWLVLADTNYCNAPDSISLTINISDKVKASFTTDTISCAPYDAVFTYTGLGGQNFLWSFGDNTTSTDKDPVHTYTNPGTYFVKLIVTDPGTCNLIDSALATIVARGKPTSKFVFTPNPPQSNTPVNFTNQSFGAIRYQWNFGDGEIINTTKRDTAIEHAYNVGGTYNACLIAYNDAGCTDTSCATIVAKVIPAYDVPNAFTPNGDGINDNVNVKGFGIKNIDWKIYNRWGTLLFQTNNLKQGWNGRVNGILQPQDVYTYILEVEFYDGKKDLKKGDITLLR